MNIKIPSTKKYNEKIASENINSSKAYETIESKIIVLNFEHMVEATLGKDKDKNNILKGKIEGLKLALEIMENTKY